MRFLTFFLTFPLCFCHEGHVTRPTQIIDVPIIVTYYTEWSIYYRNYSIKEIPGDKLTHLNYAFAKPTIEGNLEIVDRFAFLEKTDFTNSTNSTDFTNSTNSSNVNGNCEELIKLKKKYRHLKTLISIGGWTLSEHFSTIMNNNVTRNNFIDNCINFMLNYGFDGLDFDWEYPGGGGLETNTINEKDGENFQIFLKDLRTKLNKTEDGKWLITLAVAADPNKIEKLEPNNIHEYIDFMNIMTYDFEGSWSPKTGHLANLYKYKNESTNTDRNINFSVHDAVKTYVLKYNVPRKKIVIGVPFYGRGFANTELPFGSLFSGVGQGTWEAGVYDYKDLPIGEEYIDNEVVSAYSYDRNQKLLISYDNKATIKRKINYIKLNKLGGIMSWSIDSDNHLNKSECLTSFIFKQMITKNVRIDANKIKFNQSIYSNIQNNDYIDIYRKN